MNSRYLNPFFNTSLIKHAVSSLHKDRSRQFIPLTGGVEGTRKGRIIPLFFNLDGLTINPSDRMRGQLTSWRGVTPAAWDGFTALHWQALGGEPCLRGAFLCSGARACLTVEPLTREHTHGATAP